MRRGTRNALLTGVAMVVVGVACGLIGRATGNVGEKEVGKELTLATANLQESKAIVNGNNAKLSGVFLNENEKTEYSYTLEVKGRKEYDATGLSLNSTFTNFESIDITIDGYSSYVDTIELSMLSSVKDSVVVKAGVGIFTYGKEAVVTTLDSYKYDAKLLHKGKIKIHIENKNEKANFELKEIVVNKSKAVEEKPSTSTSALEI